MGPCLVLMFSCFVLSTDQPLSALSLWLVQLPQKSGLGI